VRGVGHEQHLAICEEFAHMDNRVFYNVVAPTLATGSAFIGITTMGEDADTNFVSKLLETRNDDGQPLFRVVRITLVCPQCTKAGKETACRHRMGDVPHWHDERRHRDIEHMMSDQVSTWLLEMRCAPCSGRARVTRERARAAACRAIGTCARRSTRTR
jgi:hypothetical protein